MRNSGTWLRLGFFYCVFLVTACSSEQDSSAREESQTPEPQSISAESASAPREPAVVSVEPLPDQTVVDATPELVAQAAPSTEPATKAVSNAPAAPAQHIVKGVVTQWSPMVLFIQPGDQVVFKQMAGHDTATVEGMIPEGAEPWQSKLGEEGYAVTIDVPGVYLYKCTPHVSLGMLGAIVVGELPPANLPQLEAHPDNKGMIGRAIRKLKQALDAKGEG